MRQQTNQIVAGANGIGSWVVGFKHWVMGYRMNGLLDDTPALGFNCLRLSSD